jgi:hypothetical protein
MSDETQADANARAVDLVREVAVQKGIQLSKIEVGVLVDAVQQDLGAESDDATCDKVRLAKVEAQTRVLSEAVVAITETSEALGTAIRAVKDEM